MDKTNMNVNKISPNAISVITIMYNSLIFVGIILLICTFGYNSVSCSIAGYSVLMAGVILICSALAFRMSSKQSGIFGIIMSLFPFFLLIGILTYSLYIYITFKDQISNGNIAPIFSNISKTSTVLIILEMILFFTATQKESFKKTSSLDSVSSLLMILFQILNIILLIYLGLTMKYFTTDG